MTTSIDSAIRWFKEKGFQSIGVPLLAVIFSFIATGHGAVIWTLLVIPSIRLVLTIIGTTIGIGLGLGLALNVHEELLAMRERQSIASSSGSENGHIFPKPKAMSQANSGLNSWAEEETAYTSLMSTAGYDVLDNTIRGHVVKEKTKFFERYYPFTDEPNCLKWRSVLLMKEQWPTLPESITLELGKFMEYIMRDFVSSWYSYIDSGVQYEDERAKRRRQEEITCAADSPDSSHALKQGIEVEKDAEKNEPINKTSKAMIFSTACHRPAPLMSAVYQSLGIAFGNLSTKVQGVNLFSLILIKWTKVFSQTFKTYRHLRKIAVSKQKPVPKNTRSSMRVTLKQDEKPDDEPRWGEISEMAMAREFMIKGKLHRAMTFGMDVPSLLFADTKGEIFGIGPNASFDDSANGSISIEDQVLEKRFFDAKILVECELDYNRVLGHRLVRALLPRAEYSSPIIRTLMTEMFAGCILTPLMSCFCPEYLNGWIIAACTESPAKDPTEQSEDKKGSDSFSSDQVSTTWAEQGFSSLPQEVAETSALSRSQTLKSVDSGQEMTLSQVEIIASIPSTESIENMMGVEMTMNQLLSRADNAVYSDSDEGIPPESESTKQDSNFIFDGADDFPDKVFDAKNSEDPTLSSDLGDAKQTNEDEDAHQLPLGEMVLPLLSMSLIDLHRFLDLSILEESELKEEEDIKWDDHGMQQCIAQLVLVIEAALLHGLRNVELKQETYPAEGESSKAAEHETCEDASSIQSFSNILFEITKDPDEFEEKILQKEEFVNDLDVEDSTSLLGVCMATPGDLFRLRSLIITWLHSGRAHHIMSVLINSQNSILKPYYHKHAFLRTQENAYGFVRQLRQLHGVNLHINAALTLSFPSIDVNEDGRTTIPKSDSTVASKAIENATSMPPERVESSLSLKLSSKFNFRSEQLDYQSVTPDPVAQSSSLMTLPQAYVSTTGLPRFLDFRRNENFSSSLRIDRERRMQSWVNAMKHDVVGTQVVCRLKGASDAAIAAHRELHQIARIFYAGTNLIALRTGARRVEPDSSKSVNSGSDTSEVVPISLLTVEMACQRRRLEVPDDDSSFLLRAQPRALNAIGVHRDQRNHDMSFKCFAASYEEPAYRPGQTKYSGGRYVRKCLLRFFPNDRTAQIVLPNDSRQLDQRKSEGLVPASIDVSAGASVPFLSSEFLRDRHLCQKWTPKGATPRSGSILASSVMETTDFTSVPRSGKAIDFVYRLSLFERPMVELSGKIFTVHDSSSTGPHRADASAIEISDAAISFALLSIGNEWQEGNSDLPFSDDKSVGSKSHRLARKSSIEMGADGYPIIWIKYTRKQGDSTVTEVKSYRASYVRAALLVTSSRQDAQLQCLVKCVKAGSARSATKQRTESYLQPTSKLLEYANSIEREKQSVLLRDLKLGMNNIDKAQLRRNGLLDPRFPTMIRELTAICDGTAQVKDQNSISVPGMISTVTVYKIKCAAVVSIIDTELADDEIAPYGDAGRDRNALFQEEWIIYRPMKDVQTLHKHLKTQIAPTEQSVSAGARLVGAAAAAFASSSTSSSHRRRKVLLPSLNQAQKQLGNTKKAIQKRCEVLNEYFKYLLAKDHPLSRSAELLMFLGAFYPLPSDVKVSEEPKTNKSDPLGRLEMKRFVISQSAPTSKMMNREFSTESDSSFAMHTSLENISSSSVENEGMESSTRLSKRNLVRSATSARSVLVSESNHSKSSETDSPDLTIVAEDRRSSVKEIEMIPSIKVKIDEVPLAKVRAALFDILRYQFDFDNANFFRNRMFSALKTMSFAITTPSEFRKMLYEAHLTYVNADALAEWIKVVSDTIFPDGVFLTSNGPTPPDELQRLCTVAKESLPKVFPDPLRAVLGAEIVQGGLDMLHEMLQNRVIVKSMAYMLMDMLWVEIFPELHDILSCNEALETED